MSNHLFACVFIAVTTTLGWLSRVTQDYDLIPWWARIPLGVVCVAALAYWLTRRLDQAGTR